MFDLVVASVLIRLFAVVFPVVTVLFCLQLDIPRNLSLQWFIAIVLMSIFVAAIVYGIGGFLHVAVVNMRSSERRAEAIEQMVRIQRYREGKARGQGKSILPLIDQS